MKKRKENNFHIFDKKKSEIKYNTAIDKNRKTARSPHINEKKYIRCEKIKCT